MHAPNLIQQSELVELAGKAARLGHMLCTTERATQMEDDRKTKSLGTTHIRPNILHKFDHHQRQMRVQTK